MPRILRLRPEDVARTGGKPLQKGKFSWITEQGRAERWIVVTCGERQAITRCLIIGKATPHVFQLAGQFSIVWNFAKVKAATTESLSFGGLPTNMDYIINGGKEEEVVDSTFQHAR